MRRRTRNFLVAGDYAQLELRIIALLTQDEPLLRIFAEKLDPHRATARTIFDYTEEEFAKLSPREQTKLRDFAKTYVYATCYGANPETVWKKIIIDYPATPLLQIQRAHRNWFRDHPAIQKWHDRSLKEAINCDYIEAPISGHRLKCYGIVDPEKVYNYPCQHTAADIINPATIRVAAALDWPKEGILIQCHDELVVDGPDPIRLMKILRECMTARVKLHDHAMEFPVDVKIGLNWGEMIKVKDEIDCLQAMRRLERGSIVYAKKTKTAKAAIKKTAPVTGA